MGKIRLNLLGFIVEIKSRKWLVSSMNGTMFDLNANDLLLFVAIVETGSLSGVSIRFNIPKAMVSRRLSLLES